MAPQKDSHLGLQTERQMVEQTVGWKVLTMAVQMAAKMVVWKVGGKVA